MRELRDHQIVAYELQGAGEAESVQGKIVGLGGGRSAATSMDLPELPPGQTYEMWTIDEGEPQPSGLFEAGEGPAIEAIGQPISGAETFAIRVEPEGGSEQPTSDPIVTADLTRGA